METIIPDMPGTSPDFVMLDGKNAQDPLHDFGQAGVLPGCCRPVLLCTGTVAISSWLFSIGLDYKMNMVAHDTEVKKDEPVFGFRPAHDGQEEFLEGIGFENHLLAVGPGSDMILGVRLELAWFSHTYIYAGYFLLLAGFGDFFYFFCGEGVFCSGTEVRYFWMMVGLVSN